MSALSLKALIIMLAEGFPASNSSITDHTVEAYAVALNNIKLEHIRTACGRFARGAVTRYSHERIPSAAELAIEAGRLQDEADKRIKWETDNPKIKHIPEGYKTTADGRFLIVPTNKPLPRGFKTIGELEDKALTTT